MPQNCSILKPNSYIRALHWPKPGAPETEPVEKWNKCLVLEKSIRDWDKALKSRTIPGKEGYLVILVKVVLEIKLKKPYFFPLHCLFKLAIFKYVVCIRNMPLMLSFFVK